MNSSTEIIKDFISKEPTAEWILKESGLPWLELYPSLPHQELLKEIKTHSSDLVPFCSNISTDSETYLARDEQAKRLDVQECVKGWEFITLYGIGSKIVSRRQDYNFLKNTQPTHKWTEVGDKCVLHKKLLEDMFILDNNITIKYAVLKPGGYTTPHTDADKVSKTKSGLTSLTFMTSNPDDCIFSFENWGRMPARQGKFYLLNVAYHHTTINNSDGDRYHLMIRIDNRDKTFADYIKDNRLIATSFTTNMQK